MKKLFPDSTSWNFDAFGLVDVPTNAIILFRAGGKDKSTLDTYETADINTDQEKYSIYNPEQLSQIRDIIAMVKAITIKVKGKVIGVNDICARSLGKCVSDGEEYIQDDFVQRVKNGTVTYPMYFGKHGPKDISLNLVGAKTENGILKAARAFKIRFFWRVDLKETAKKWNTEFQDVMADFVKDDDNFMHELDIAYSTSQSLEEELVKGTTGDIIYFTLTMVLMIIYSILVSAGGDVVSTRALLACGGVLAAAMGIVGALGLLCLFQVDLVGFVGIMPFLVLGIGVDDMFLMMSAWGESIALKTDVPHRVGSTFSKAGIGITITTLTDFLAFLIGISSSFIAVRQFCIYTALAVLFCYLANVTLFGACLSLHGDRVYSAKHCLLCVPVKTRQYYRDKGSNCCTVYCCGGAVPTREFEDESICEKLPRFLLPRIILNPICKVLILLGLCGVLGASIYGAIKLEPGMRYVDLVLRSSYYYKYSSWDEAYFGSRLAIAFSVDGHIDYGGEEGDAFRVMMSDAQRDKAMDRDFIRCWLHEYSRSPLYPPQPRNTSLFVQNLLVFLRHKPLFYNDVTLGPYNKTIIASRCYVLTKNEVKIFKQAEMMKRVRRLADDMTEFKANVYQPVFVMLEHTLAILPSTLQTVGTAVAVMFVVTLMMLPQLLMVLLVTLNIVFIITCVFGSMYYMDISFSGISMIHILMSVGFSVDFSAHICAAYLMSDSRFRHERARYALVHASGPIFNGGMSSLVGVSMLMMSESYFFRSFFKIMSMVITSGAVNSVFFMPIILSYIGPENTDHDLKRLSMVSIGGSVHLSDQHSGVAGSTGMNKVASLPSAQSSQNKDQAANPPPAESSDNANQNKMKTDGLTADDSDSAVEEVELHDLGDPYGDTLGTTISRHQPMDLGSVPLRSRSVQLVQQPRPRQSPQSTGRSHQASSFYGGGAGGETPPRSSATTWSRGPPAGDCDKQD
ncbi:patched domain-containing protein 3-like [Babylonia areolata]|uniref:patched domain-containing protein 3-like n=1 Tax=Babylonia areolata TaxID=304850 RepID=UPI003FD289C4